MRSTRSSSGSAALTSFLYSAISSLYSQGIVAKSIKPRLGPPCPDPSAKAAMSPRKGISPYSRGPAQRFLPYPRLADALPCPSLQAGVAFFHFPMPQRSRWGTAPPAPGLHDPRPWTLHLRPPPPSQRRSIKRVAPLQIGECLRFPKTIKPRRALTARRGARTVGAGPAASASAVPALGGVDACPSEARPARTKGARDERPENAG